MDWMRDLFLCCNPPDSRLWCFLDQMNHMLLGEYPIQWVCRQHDKKITKLAEKWDEEN